MDVAIVGEDAVTQNVIAKLIGQYRKDIVITETLPARGGKIKQLAPKYNKLGSPVILLTDLDQYDCPPSLINDWFDEPISNSLLFRIAYTEAESWLMADRAGFANWLSIDVNLMPHSIIVDRRKRIQEMNFPYKPSLFMMKELVSLSRKAKLKEDLTPREGAKKGPAYNSALLPFIEAAWDINAAILNSYSLGMAVQRIKEFNP